MQLRGRVVLGLLAAWPGLAAAQPETQPLPLCWGGDWKSRCRAELACVDDRTRSCTYVFPVDCAEFSPGQPETDLELRYELKFESECGRHAKLAKGGAGAAHDPVSSFDWSNGPLQDLPHGLNCIGTLSRQQDEWCDYVTAVYPDATFLESTQTYPEFKLRRIPRTEQRDCRMQNGRLSCAEDAGASTPHLTDVAFSDVNGDGTLDAVARLEAYRSSVEVTFTRHEPDGPLLLLNDLGPSFDCKKASRANEKRLCSNRALARLDLTMARLYRFIRERAPETGSGSADDLRSEQRAFVKQRDQRCSATLEDVAAVACLTHQYEGRVETLRAHLVNHRCKLLGLECLDSRAALLKGIRLLDKDRQEASRLLASSDTSLGWAYLSFLQAEHGGSTAEIEQSYRRGYELLTEPRILDPPADPPTLEDTLRLLRFAVEDFQIEGLATSDLMWCSPFETHTTAAFAAFTGGWGSSRDALADSARTACMVAILERTLSKDTMNELVRGMTELKDALGVVLPVPMGTMYLSFAMSNAKILDKSVFVPQPYVTEQSEEDLDQALQNAIDEATTGNPGLRERAGEYRKIQERVAPAIAKAICEVAQANARSLSESECLRAAQGASARMLTAHLTSMQL